MEKRPNIRDIPARCEYSSAIEPYRILEAGASLGLPERPEMRDTLLFSIKKDARSYSRIPTFVRTNSRRACAEAALRAADILVRPGEATVILAYRSGRLASRESDLKFSAYAATSINRRLSGLRTSATLYKPQSELHYDIKPCGASRQPKSGGSL